jgi:hypothetical protein
MPAVSDAVWSEQGTTPDRVEAALRSLLAERHAENVAFVPARVLNMIAFEDAAWSGEIANRLRGVGRYHASRLVVLSYERRRQRLDARVSVASEGDPRPGELSLLRETVVVELGERHLDDLATIADPLVVSDLPTLLWSPHGHREVVGELLGLAQAVLVDSVDEPEPREAIAYARTLAEQAYVVDLGWLRSTPWRERIATTFDPPARRGGLGELTSIEIRHHPESAVTAMLLVGWLASRLGWLLDALSGEEGDLRGLACAGHAPPANVEGHTPVAGAAQPEPPTGAAEPANGAATTGREVAVQLRATREQQVRGLAGLTLKTASGWQLRLDRGPGGLHARSTDGGGAEREWTILGASRGEGGILGEGIRQALLRDPTYAPALAAAQRLAP